MTHYTIRRWVELKDVNRPIWLSVHSNRPKGSRKPGQYSFTVNEDNRRVYKTRKGAQRTLDKLNIRSIAVVVPIETNIF